MYEPLSYPFSNMLVFRLEFKSVPCYIFPKTLKIVLTTGRFNHYNMTAIPGISRDKTMVDKLMYIPKQNSRKIPKVVKPSNKKKLL